MSDGHSGEGRPTWRRPGTPGPRRPARIAGLRSLRDAGPVPVSPEDDTALAPAPPVPPAPPTPPASPPSPTPPAGEPLPPGSGWGEAEAPGWTDPPLGTAAAGEGAAAPLGADATAEDVPPPARGPAPANIGAPVTAAAPDDDGLLVPAEQPGQRRRGLVVAVAALLALDIALGVTGGVLALRHASQDAATAARRGALNAAVSEIVPVLTLDYLSLKADERKALAGLTPAFGHTYYTSVLAPFDKLASQEHAQVQSSVSAAAVISASSDRAQVLAFVDTQRLSKVAPQGTIFGERLRLSMTRVGGRWLISGIVAE